MSQLPINRLIRADGHTLLLRLVLVVSAINMLLWICVYGNNLTPPPKPVIAKFTAQPEQISSAVAKPQEQQNIDDDWGSVRLAILLTTHVSNQHLFSLDQCWPGMVNKSRLLQNANVFLFSARELDESLLQKAFNQTRGIARVELYDNGPGRQPGAKLPVEEAINNRDAWFGTYDWIIRLNPDVLIRDDGPLLPLLKNPDVDAIIVNCWDNGEILVQTDFFAVRPTALPNEPVECRKYSAENHFTAQIQKVLESGRYAFLPGAGPVSPGHACRVYGSTIMHDHGFVTTCPQAFEDGNG